MTIEINGVKINYEIYGEGEPLLVLHGWSGCIASMNPIITYYAKRFKVIAIDFPSHGKSDMISNWNVTDYMNNLYGFIQALGLKDLRIICHSFGGRVSILLTALHPELVKKLILIDSGGMLQKRTLKYYIKLYVYKIGKHIMKLRFKNKDDYNKWLDEQRAKRGSNDYNALPPEMRNTFVKIVNQNLKPYLKQIHCPTLIIWGEFDKSTPVYMGNQIHKGIKDSQYHVLENCGHFSYLDNFREVSRLIDEFI